MKDLAPEIFRQRLIIEGIYTKKPTSYSLVNFMRGLSKKLKMTIIHGPMVHNLAGQLNPLHQGFECNMIWAESGVAIYTWNKNSFFSIDIYTCKKFKPRTAIEYAKDFFKTKKIEYKDI